MAMIFTAAPRKGDPAATAVGKQLKTNGLLVVIAETASNFSTTMADEVLGVLTLPLAI